MAALVAALSGRLNYGAAGFLVATVLAGTLLGLAAWDLFVGLLATRFAPYLALPKHITLGLPRGIVPFPSPIAFLGGILAGHQIWH